MKLDVNKIKGKIGLIGIIAIIIGIAVIVSAVGVSKKEIKPTESKKKMTLLNEKVEKDLWIASEGQNIKAIEKKQEDLNNSLEKVVKDIEELKKKKQTAVPQQNVKLSETLPPLPAQTQTPPLHEKLPLPSPQQVQNKQITSSTVSPAVLPPTLPQKQEKEDIQQQAPTSTSTSIRVFKSKANSTENEGSKDNSKSAETKKDNKQQKRKIIKYDLSSYLPIGFTKATLLFGIDAPTAESAIQQPYPVLMTLTNLSHLPNRYKTDLRECFLIGAAYGNMSDERAYIRTETLSCVKNNGDILESPLQGHVVGEDGKLGMRGRLVNKQGQRIAMSILAGTLAGFGQAFKPQQAFSINLNSSGASASSPSFGDVVTGGFLGGASNALNDIAKYYLKVAEKIFPIIEIDAGRTVEIVTLKGQRIDTSASTHTEDETEQKNLISEKQQNRKNITVSGKTKNIVTGGQKQQENSQGVVD